MDSSSGSSFSNPFPRPRCGRTASGKQVRTRDADAAISFDPSEWEGVPSNTPSHSLLNSNQPAEIADETVYRL